MKWLRAILSHRESREGWIVSIYGLGALLVVMALAASNDRVLDRFRVLVFDAYQRVLPREEAKAPILLVDIDEASLDALGQWPWPRSTLARIVDRLGEAGAAAIAFDMVFPEADRTSPARVVDGLQKAGIAVVMPVGQTGIDNDETLASAFSRNGVVAGFAISDETDGFLAPPKTAFAYGGRDPRGFLKDFSGGVSNLAALETSAAGAGFFSFPPSADGILRRVPLLQQARGALFPALAPEMLRVAQGATTLLVKSTGASGETDGGAPAITGLKVGDIEVPTAADGSFWVYFSGLPSMKTMSAIDLLNDEVVVPLASKIAGRLVIIGTSAVGLRDMVATPTNASMPGMRVHAEILDQMLGGMFLDRPDWMHGLELSAAAVLGLVLLLAIRSGSATFGSAATVGLVLAALTVSWVGFSGYRLLIDPILPSATVLVVFAVTMPVLLLLTNREKKFVRAAFSQYLSPTLVERLADDPASLKLGGEMRELTVLFSDIRSFTSISEKLDPTALTTLLNDFLTPMTDILLKSHATIDKYMGDAIVAFWNAPLDIPDHRRKACLATLRMVDELKHINATGAVPLKIGIGLNTAACCVGNLGSSQRFSYSAIGDGMNVASRVEGMTKEYGIAILATQAVRDGAPELAFLEVDLVRVVGRAEPLPLHALFGDADMAEQPYFAAVREYHGRMINAYREGRFDLALKALADAQDMDFAPLAKIHSIYADRLTALLGCPAPSDWDGVFAARSK